MSNLTITSVPGIRVGHAHNLDALTGCTVILTDPPAVGGVDQRGGAPGTRETDALRPARLVDQVHGVLLTGGSAFGLDAASGVMRYLEEHGQGYDTGVAKVPIVPAAVLFDLDIGSATVRPDAAMGYAACLAANSDPVAQGCVGAGAGATVGKILGMGLAVKSGIGSVLVAAGGGIMVGAIVAVNAAGDVMDPATGAIRAGLRSPTPVETGPWADSLKMLQLVSEQMSQPPATNTVIGVIATNARLNKEEANYAAQMAQDGIARAVRPAHTLFDGDTLFLLANGTIPANVSLIGALAAEAVAGAILQAVTYATAAGGLPAMADVPGR